MTDLLRECKKCGSVAEHYKGSWACKECTKAYNREQQQKPEIRTKRLARLKEVRETPEGKAKAERNSWNFYHSNRGRALTFLKGIERRSKNRHEKHSVTLDHLQKGLDSGRCAVTSIPFVMGEKCSKGMNPFAPSVDRIDSSKPYSNDNCRIVIWAYNMAKGQMTDDQLYEICLAVVRSRDE
jgi:hypothetical protein